MKGKEFLFFELSTSKNIETDFALEVVEKCVRVWVAPACIANMSLALPLGEPFPHSTTQAYSL
jgi:hypothetical protein